MGTTDPAGPTHLPGAATATRSADAGQSPMGTTGCPAHHAASGPPAPAHTTPTAAASGHAALGAAGAAGRAAQRAPAASVRPGAAAPSPSPTSIPSAIPSAACRPGAGSTSAIDATQPWLVAAQLDRAA